MVIVIFRNMLFKVCALILLNMVRGLSFFQDMYLHFSCELFGIEHVSLLDEISRRSLRG